MELTLTMLLGPALIGGWTGLANGRIGRLRNDQQAAQTMGVRRSWFSSHYGPKRGLPLLICTAASMAWLLLGFWFDDWLSLMLLAVMGPHSIGLMLSLGRLKFQFLTSLVVDTKRQNQISLTMLAISFATLLYTLSQGVPQ